MNAPPLPRPYAGLLPALLCGLMVCLWQAGMVNADAAPPKTSADPPTLHFLRLANGNELNASIVDYSLQSRVLTLQLINGQTVHVSPRDLTAMSKLTWLLSPAFAQTLQHYQPSDKAIATAIERLALPVVGMLVAVFLFFWWAVTVISGQKRIIRAGKTFMKSGLQVLLIAIALAVAHSSVAKALAESPVAPMLHSILFTVAFCAMIMLASNQIGVDYDLSGWMGFGVILTTAGIGLVIATCTLYLLPRYLERPGLDDWFTDQLLVPLGLA
jgi:hypothetical protein